MTACRREKEADFNPLSTQSHFKEGELIIANRKCLQKQLYYTLANFFPARRCYLHRCKKMALPRKPRKRLSDLTSLFLRSLSNNMICLVTNPRAKILSQPFIQGTKSVQLMGKICRQVRVLVWPGVHAGHATSQMAFSSVSALCSSYGSYYVYITVKSLSSRVVSRLKTLSS